MLDQHPAGSFEQLALGDLSVESLQRYHQARIDAATAPSVADLVILSFPIGKDLLPDSECNPRSLVGTAFQHLHPAGAGEVSKFQCQAGFAHARFAAKHEHVAASAFGPVQRRTQSKQFGPYADE